MPCGPVYSWVFVEPSNVLTAPLYVFVGRLPSLAMACPRLIMTFSAAASEAAKSEEEEEVEEAMINAIMMHNSQVFPAPVHHDLPKRSS